MMRASISFIILFVFTIIRSGHGQSVNTSNIVPPSPEVSALAKYIDMPIGYSTGTPEINIPIYSVKNEMLQLPISLSYNASGIKVEEVATWVGLGWNLSCGGSVSRVVRGQPDDYSSFGYMYTSKTAKYILALPLDNNERSTLLHDAFTGDLDIEPDMYMFSVMGYSGKFYYDQQLAKFVLTPYQRIKIDHTTDGNGYIKSFQLTLPNGIKCYFGISKDSSHTAYETFTSQTTTVINNGTQSEGPPSTIPSHITSWQVLDIVSPSNKAIQFYYSTYSATDFGSGGESTDHAGVSGCTAATGYNNSSTYNTAATKSVLQRISSDLGDVFFIQSAHYRQDVLGFQKALDSIIVKNKSGKRIKSFLFSYDYMPNPDG